MKFKNQNRGFTIVELLVVIVVIAILVALTLPNLFGLQRRARDDTRKNDLKNVQQALETYYNDNSHYPDQLSALVTQYINAIPSDPKGGSYTYTPSPNGCTTACTSYTLSATLENTSDPAANNGVYTINSVNQ
jgi:prepilin-type N-terminal cleavage/methylation domain-containing protein